MKSSFSSILIIVVALWGCRQGVEEPRRQIAVKMEASLKSESLDKWYPQSLDTLYGGFLSSFTYDFKPTGEQEKMIVTQARHT